MLVVAQDTDHANALGKLMEDEAFFEGQYKGQGHHCPLADIKGEEKDETSSSCSRSRDPDNPDEIVIHVNMLKEGWDVTNLYTIVPLRAANSRTLVEQSIGRGLRLPYGKRTGVAAVDRLTIVSHDQFQEIIDEANRPDSIIRTEAVIIGKDVPTERPVSVEIPSNIDLLVGARAQTGGDGATGRVMPGVGALPATAQQYVFETPAERAIAGATVDVVRQLGRSAGAGVLSSPERRDEIVAAVTSRIVPVQTELDGHHCYA